MRIAEYDEIKVKVEVKVEVEVEVEKKINPIVWTGGEIVRSFRSRANQAGSF